MTRRLPVSVLVGTPAALVVLLAGLLGAQERAQPRQDQTEAQPGPEGKDETGVYMPIRRTEPGGGGKDQTGTGASPSRPPAAGFRKGALPDEWNEIPARPVAASPPPPPAESRSPSPIAYPVVSTRLLTDADLAGQTVADLRMALNEIFARHGYEFHDPALRAHFRKQPWYRPTQSSQDRVREALSPIERSNVALLRERIEGTPPPRPPAPPPAEAAPAPKAKDPMPVVMMLGAIAVLVVLAGLAAVLTIRRRRLRI